MSLQDILITGGAGYIGSHVCIALLQAGYGVIVVDNLSNSSAVALERVQAITEKPLIFYNRDLRDGDGLSSLFERHELHAVIHLAGLKAVGESGERALDYYENNVGGTMSLCRAMMRHGVRNMVFSSSATVYGEPARLPVAEHMDTSPENPYARTKLTIENLLRDIQAADPDWQISILRYFNPVGAHESGEIGENPRGVPNNLMPFISQVAAGRLKRLRIFGDDYPTADGTGVRDYVHVMDLAGGHLKALQKLNRRPGLIVHNLGAGRGYSVLEVVRCFEHATGVRIPYEIVARRAGDIAVCYADCSLAHKELHWRAEHDLGKMCEDAWRWQSGQIKTT